jgi:uncharacterized protein with FMN-binding domain
MSPVKWSFMKKLFLMIMMLSVLGCAFQEMIRVRQMDIQNVDINSIQDGEYIGSYSYSGFEYKVKTIVSAQKILDIEILQNRDTEHARCAEGVLTEILKRQTPNVDAISGATTTSRALMKAVENSLIYKTSM